MHDLDPHPVRVVIVQQKYKRRMVSKALLVLDESAALLCRPTPGDLLAFSPDTSGLPLEISLDQALGQIFAARGCTMLRVCS
jgi:hypothetical protein